MKKLIFLILAILMVSNVSALFADNNLTTSIVTTIPKCEYVFVNVTGSLAIEYDANHTKEYNLIGCEELGNDSNYWYCNCTDNYNLIMNVSFYAVNNYTIITEAFYPGSLNTDDPSSGHSSGGTTIIYKYPLNETINETIKDTFDEELIIEDINITAPINDTEDMDEESTPAKISATVWGLIIAIIILLLIIIFGWYLMNPYSE